DAAVLVDDPHAGADRVLHRAPEDGLRGERMLGLLAPGDVVGDRIETRLGVAPVDADGPAEPAPGIALPDTELQRPDAVEAPRQRLLDDLALVGMDPVVEDGLGRIAAEILLEG